MHDGGANIVNASRPDRFAAVASADIASDASVAANATAGIRFQ